MAFITVTNTFTNGTASDATEVNTNFTDLTSGLSDGTKDISMSSATLASLTASRALVSSAAKVITSSSVTSTELGYVSGVTSAIQTQLGAKVASTSLTAWGASSWTPTGAFTTNTTYAGKYRRVGDTGCFQVYITFAGAPNSITQLTVNLPGSHTIDTAKLAASTSQRQRLAGSQGTFNDASATGLIYDLFCGYESTTSVNVFINNQAGGGSPELLDHNSPTTIAASDSISLYFEVPIVEYA